MIEKAETISRDRTAEFSMATPSDADIAWFRSLSPADRQKLVERELEKGRTSGLSDKSMADLWQEALKRSGQ